MIRPISVSPPQYPPQKPSYPVYPPSTGGGSSSNVTNITNIDNSINDSFNNYNSNNVIVAAVTPSTPTTPVYQTPYCSIHQAQASGSGTGAYLSWTSSNATSAYLTNVGSVQLNGSQSVWPTNTTTYVLTVYGQNGQTSQCQATVYANNAPYVSLTQIPYTGFDFGPFGNAMYWAGLAIFALGAGYLAIYYVPALAVAGSAQRKFAPVVAPMAPILVEKQEALAVVHPVVAKMRKAGTTDTMAIVTSKDGSMPKIVIERN